MNDQNKHVTKLIDIFRIADNKGFSIFIVMECLETDLKKLMDGKSSMDMQNLTEE